MIIIIPIEQKIFDNKFQELTELSYVEISALFWKPALLATIVAMKKTYLRKQAKMIIHLRQSSILKGLPSVQLSKFFNTYGFGSTLTEYFISMVLTYLVNIQLQRKLC